MLARKLDIIVKETSAEQMGNILQKPFYIDIYCNRDKRKKQLSIRHFAKWPCPGTVLNGSEYSQAMSMSTVRKQRSLRTITSSSNIEAPCFQHGFLLAGISSSQKIQEFSHIHTEEAECVHFMEDYEGMEHDFVHRRNVIVLQYCCSGHEKMHFKMSWK